MSIHIAVSISVVTVMKTVMRFDLFARSRVREDGIGKGGRGGCDFGAGGDCG